jgi:hypothetical protein
MMEVVMHPQDTGHRDVLERAILNLLLTSERAWTGAEIGRELDDHLAVADALFDLCAAGLVDETGGVVYPTRTAVRAYQLSRT